MTCCETFAKIWMSIACLLFTVRNRCFVLDFFSWSRCAVLLHALTTTFTFINATAVGFDTGRFHRLLASVPLKASCQPRRNTRIVGRIRRRSNSRSSRYRCMGCNLPPRKQVLQSHPEHLRNHRSDSHHRHRCSSSCLSSMDK